MMKGTLQRLLARPHARDAAIAVVVCVYVCAQYVVLKYTGKNEAMALSLLPILVAGWLRGWRAAILIGVVTYVVGIPLLHVAIGTEHMLAGRVFGILMISLYTLIGMLVGAISDVTKQLKSELKRRKSVEKQLRDSNRELVDFAHIASHDLQEPLRKVTAFGDRLQARAGDALDERSKDYLARMQNAAVRMSGLLSGLLNYARVTTQGNPFIPVDLDFVTAGVLGDLEIRIGETGGRVDTGKLGTVTADPLQMRQLIQNLVGNALKYHKPDVPPVVKLAGAVTADGKWYELTVADNGIGIADEDKKKAFGIFQRLVGKNEYEGTGVGLSICKKIAERHNGTICLEGVVGEGTVFTVRVPNNRKPGRNA